MKTPYIFNDADVYSANSQEVNFALNARNLLDYGFGQRFDEQVVRKLNLSVGFLHHTNEMLCNDEDPLLSFIRLMEIDGVMCMYALPTGYPHDKKNTRAMEVAEFDPPLIGKLNLTTSSVCSSISKIRSGQIGLYSNKVYFFSPCLTYSILDLNGGFSMFMGPRDAVEKALGCSVEDSWRAVREQDQIAPSLFPSLLDAMKTYGY